MTKSRTKTLTVAAAISCALITTAHAAVTISNAKTKNMNCTGGMCTPTGSNANLNVGDLVAMLASSDVTVKSSASAPSLGVLDPLTWASTHRLTLDAYQSIHVRAPMVVEGTAGLTLTTNDGGTGGDYIFEDGGYADFWDLASSLVINGQSFTLVSDVKTLASAIALHPSRNYALSGRYNASADGVYHAAPVATAFNGTLEGLGHAIANLSISLSKDQSYGGLFAHVGKKGTVRDLGLAHILVAAGGGLLGSLAAINDGTLINDTATGDVGTSQGGTVGGLVGQDSGKIIASSSSTGAGASTDCYVGGLVGEVLPGGVIEGSHATRGAGGQTRCHAGGLAGINGGKIQNSYATGDVYGGNTTDQVAWAGGLVGLNYGSIAGSFATGDASATCCVSEFSGAVVGGLVGLNQGGTIRNSYATGSAISSDQSEVGGLVGENDGTVSLTYATGEAVNGKPAYAGGLVGYDGPYTTLSYWNLNTSRISDPGQGAGTPRNDPGITGLTDAQLKSALPAGFNPQVWGQDPNINRGWPYLLANPPPQ